MFRRPPRDAKGAAKRTRRRSAAVLAVAVAVGVGVLAFPASSVAAPPVVPACTFPNTAGSDSCTMLRVNAYVPPIGGTFENVGVGFRWRSQFNPQTSETTNIELRFDDDIKVDLAGIPTCPSSELVGKNMPAAWEQCGPGADEQGPPNEGNAYLSTALGNSVSGISSGLPVGPQGGVSCVMLFKGADNNHVTLYARWPVDSEIPTDNCDNPASNTAGSASILFTLPLDHRPPQTPYDRTFTMPNSHTWNPALDDLYATVQRGGAFEARCPAGTSPLGLRGLFDYTAPGDAQDIDDISDPCP